MGTCRGAIDPACPWAEIGQELGRLLTVNPPAAGGPGPVHLTIRTLAHNNSLVALRHDGERLVAVKRHLFARGPWEVPHHGFQEMLALSRLARCAWAPRVVFQAVHPNHAEIGFEYIPLSMKQVRESGIFCG